MSSMMMMMIMTILNLI
jgi:DNA replication licensing factor MCM5